MNNKTTDLFNKEWLITENNNIYALNEKGTNLFHAQIQSPPKENVSDEDLRKVAKLMAAAPKLYNALLHVTEYSMFMKMDPDSQEVVEQALAAVEK